MENYIGEIRAFAFNRIPRGWLPCEGQVMQIAQYQDLFSLLGNRFGGDARTNFCLPDLRGHAMLGYGKAASSVVYLMGESNGAEKVSLDFNTTPCHTHAFNVSDGVGTDRASLGVYLAKKPSIASIEEENVQCYVPPGSSQPYALSGVSTTGEGVAHENRMPLQAVLLCIAYTGNWPPRP